MPTDPVDDMITAILKREGGYVDNPSDRGGPTCWGVTISTLRDWRRRPVTKEEVAALTEAEARQIFRTLYFTAGGFENIKEAALQAFMFDFAINSGVATASRALQAALGVGADGMIGPITLSALTADNNPKALFYMVKCQRYEVLLRYVGKDPSQAIFAGGWSNRLDQFEDR